MSSERFETFPPTLAFDSVPGACPACRTKLAIGSRFCAACGIPLVAPPPAPSASPPAAPPEPANGSASPSRPVSAPISALVAKRVSGLLAEANLMRLRSSWNEAEAGCVEAMRLDPSNVHAHSLLGDIYRDQHKFEQAAQWYQLSLDLNPDNVSDKAKLLAVEDEIARMLAQAALPSDRRNTSVRLGTQNLAGLAPATWLNFIWAAFGLFAITAGILIVNGKNRRTLPADQPTGTVTGSHVSTVAQPPGNDPRPGTAASPAPGSQSITPDAPPLSTPSPANGQNNSTGNGTTTEQRPLLSERETVLYNTLRRPETLGSYLSLDALSIDPQTQRVNVGLIEQAGNRGLNPDAIRDVLVRDAYRIAQTTFATDIECQKAAVNIRISAGNSSPENGFSAEMDRLSAQRPVDYANTGALLAAFTNVIWGPSFALSAGSGVSSGLSGSSSGTSGGNEGNLSGQ